MKNPWIIVILVTAVLIGGSVWYANQAEERNNDGVLIEPNYLGGEDPIVTLTEYSDFQCPACAAFQPVVKELLAEHGEALRLEYNHFPLPFHNLAAAAARAAEAAGQQGKFFAYHDTLFENQASWSKSTNSTRVFEQYAADLGLDVDKFKRHFNSSIIRDHVRAQGEKAIELGLTGTPTFLLNGERMNIETYDDFRNQIAAAINPELNSEINQD